MDYVKFIYRPLATRAARRALVGRNRARTSPCRSVRSRFPEFPVQRVRLPRRARPHRPRNRLRRRQVPGRRLLSRPGGRRPLFRDLVQLRLCARRFDPREARSHQDAGPRRRSVRFSLELNIEASGTKIPPCAGGRKRPAAVQANPLHRVFRAGRRSFRACDPRRRPSGQTVGNYSRRSYNGNRLVAQSR